MGVVALLIKLTSRGPVIFTQTRAGLRGSPFTMYKFRSMYTGAEEARAALASRNEKSGPVFKIADDPRLTPLGRWLRKSSIDELPQLVNVLRGEMSLVGPRPLWMPEAIRVVGRARIRADVKPGLTCLWQISGRSELSYDEWVALDAYYVYHRSMWLDLMIMVQTVPAVLSARGAY
jgi:lipopolysaccharide/colanic/teichoic acid biosynthesis glycosyltransferase